MIFFKNLSYHTTDVVDSHSNLESSLTQVCAQIQEVRHQQ